MNSAVNQIQSAIEDLKLEINAIQLDLDAKLRSLGVLEGIYGKMLGNTEHKNSSPLVAMQPFSAQPSDDEFNVDDLFADQPKKRTFTDETRSVVEKFGAKEFNINIVEIAMNKFGIAIAGKSPKSRISVSLNKLCDEGFLMRTFNGSGNIPNKYRIKSTMTEGEIQYAENLNKLHSILQTDSEEDLA